MEKKKLFEKLVNAIYAIGDEPSLQAIRQELDSKLGNEVQNLFAQCEREENNWGAWVEGVLR